MAAWNTVFYDRLRVVVGEVIWDDAGNVEAHFLIEIQLTDAGVAGTYHNGLAPELPALFYGGGDELLAPAFTLVRCCY